MSSMKQHNEKLTTDEGAEVSSTSLSGVVVDVDKVLEIVFGHCPEIFTIPDLGRLSICSKESRKLVEGSSLWKNIYNDAASKDAEESPRGHTNISWAGETGLVSCFASPDERVIKSVGYFKVCRMLLSSLCQNCGKLTGDAHPITWKRTCDECLALQPSSWVVVKAKAKQVFLLTDKELTALHHAKITPGSGPTGATATVYSYQDVLAKSYEKWGGVAGLETEIIRRTKSAVERYTKSQSTDKPQKKRPKIENVDPRPAENPMWKITSKHLTGIPAGVLVPKKATDEGCKYVLKRCAKCNHHDCRVVGLLKDVETHELLDHGITNWPGGAILSWHGESSHKIEDHLVGPKVAPLTLDSLGFPAELVTTLSSLSVQRSSRNFWHFWSQGTYETIEIVSKSTGTKIMLNHDTLKQQLLREFLELIGLNEDAQSITDEEKHSSRISAYCKVAGSHVAVTLFECSEGKNPHRRHEYEYIEPQCNLKGLSKAMKSLGLTETSPKLFVAGILSMAFNKTEILDLEPHAGGGEYGLSKLPFLKDAVLYLQDNLKNVAVTDSS